jgi:hypothetical protein
MAYNNKATTSIYGRRLGLQGMSTGQTGGALASGASQFPEFLVGAEDIRLGVTTAESTAANAKAYGISNFPGTSAGSSSVYPLDPPIPGVRKFLVFSTTANGVYVKTANSETFLTTMGTSFTTIKSTVGGVLELIGFTTAIWLAPALTSGTSSQASGFVLSTTT